MSTKMRVAVITPYCGESVEMLRQCHDSVVQQTHACTHFMIADGSPRVQVETWPVEHLTLSRRHDDNGNTPRAIGSLSAMNLGFDAIAHLDADNWLHPDHVESMVELHELTKASLVVASRNLHRLDGTKLCQDTFGSNGKDHVDTSCMFYTRGAYRVLPLWAMMPKQLGPVGDRFIWKAILARRITYAINPLPTVAFRSQYANHYRTAGEEPPPGLKTDETTGVAWDWWRALPEEVRRDWQRYFNEG